MSFICLQRQQKTEQIIAFSVPNAGCGIPWLLDHLKHIMIEMRMGNVPSVEYSMFSQAKYSTSGRLLLVSMNVALPPPPQNRAFPFRVRNKRGAKQMVKLLCHMSRIFRLRP